MTAKATTISKGSKIKCHVLLRDEVQFLTELSKVKGGGGGIGALLVKECAVNARFKISCNVALYFFPRSDTDFWVDLHKPGLSAPLQSASTGAAVDTSGIAASDLHLEDKDDSVTCVKVKDKIKSEDCYKDTRAMCQVNWLKTIYTTFSRMKRFLNYFLASLPVPGGGGRNGGDDQLLPLCDISLK